MLVNIWCGDLAGIVAGELERCAASMQGAQVWDHLQGSPLPDVYFQAAVLAACRLGSLILFALAYSGTTSFCAFFLFICGMRGEKIWCSARELLGLCAWRLWFLKQTEGGGGADGIGEQKSWRLSRAWSQQQQGHWVNRPPDSPRIGRGSGRR